MSLYASDWEEITKQEYLKLYYSIVDPHVYSSYTNLEGNDGLTYLPQVYRSWGDSEKEIVKFIKLKRDIDEPEWDCYCYKAIAWDIEG